MIMLLGVTPGPPFVRYELDPLSGRFERTTHPDRAEAARGASGWGDVRVIGLRCKEEIFVAIYSHEKQLHVTIPPQTFSWPGRYVARRRSTWSRVKSFRIAESVRTYLFFRYTFIDSRHGFPGPEVADIFLRIARETATRERILTFALFWEAHAAGEDVTSERFQRWLAASAKGGRSDAG
jgi:hypothetical protein